MLHYAGAMERHERLQWARENRGRFESVSAAARAMDIPISTAIAHENGGRVFGYDECEAYARRYKVAVEWLAFGIGKPTGFKEIHPSFPWETWAELQPQNRQIVIDLMRTLQERQVPIAEPVDEVGTHGFVIREGSGPTTSFPSGTGADNRATRKSKGS